MGTDADRLPEGANRATDQAAAEAVGARRPVDLGQGGPIAASADAATVGLGMPGSGPPPGSVFDEYHPPDAGADRRLRPLWILPADVSRPMCCGARRWTAPRGRIDIMKSGLQGDAFDASSVRHLDQCLGCMACVTACPSGVQYDKLIEATRAQLDRRVERPRRERLLRKVIYGLFPYPRRLKVLRGPLRAYQASRLGRLLARTGLLARLPESLQAMESLAPKLGHVEKLPERTPAVGAKRRTVGLLTGCVQGSFFPDVNVATVRVLAAEGCEVVVPRKQSCCGALSAHAGREPEALAFAKRVIDDVRGRGRRQRRGERGGLRVQPQGLRPPAAR